jgi:hypothetical protein
MAPDTGNPNFIVIDGTHVLLDHVQWFEHVTIGGDTGIRYLRMATAQRVFEFPDDAGVKLDAVRRAFDGDADAMVRPYDRSRRMAVMTEKDSFLIEAALLYGFDPDPNDDGEDGEHGRYVCNGVSIVQFVKAIRQETEDDVYRKSGQQRPRILRPAGWMSDTQLKGMPPVMDEVTAKVGDFDAPPAKNPFRHGSAPKAEPDPKDVSPCGCPTCIMERVETLMSRTLGSFAKPDMLLLEQVKGRALSDEDAEWWCGLSVERRMSERPKLRELAGALEGDPAQVIGKVLKIILGKAAELNPPKFDFSPGAFNADASKAKIEKLSTAELAVHDVEMLETYHTGGKPLGMTRMVSWLSLSDDQRMIERLRILELLAAGHNQQG